MTANKYDSDIYS